MHSRSSPEDDEPGVGGLVGVGPLVVGEGHLVPLVLVERVLGHQLGVSLKDLPVGQRNITCIYVELFTECFSVIWKHILFLYYDIIQSEFYSRKGRK